MIHGKGRVPYLSRELQRKNNNGENSHLNFSLYPREICNTTVNLFREVLACTIKRITALAVNKNNLIFRASYERAYFRGKLASASLKLSHVNCRWLLDGLVQYFRGKLASASLKRGLRDYTRWDLRSMDVISEANLPRPH